MEITTIGVDLAKSVFHLHGTDKQGRKLMSKKLRREEFKAYFVNLRPCLIGMEACGSAHYWARELQALGHTVKLMAPQFVKPYVKSQKNDRNDAEAIAEAVTRPTMRFVAIKTEAQQAILALHRARQGFIKDRTALSNRIRGLLAEFGIIVPMGVHRLLSELPTVLDHMEDTVPPLFQRLIRQLYDHLTQLMRQVRQLDKEMLAWHRQSVDSQRLEAIPGVGVVCATALVASLGNAHTFKNGRQVAAWLGLVPRQHSTGGKPVLLGISKQGDTYLRTLLIHGARAALLAAQRKPTGPTGWLADMLQRRHPNITVVAMANRTARIAWALLARQEAFRPGYTGQPQPA